MRTSCRLFARVGSKHLQPRHRQRYRRLLSRPSAQLDQFVGQRRRCDLPHWETEQNHHAAFYLTLQPPMWTMEEQRVLQRDLPLWQPAGMATKLHWRFRRLLRQLVHRLDRRPAARRRRAVEAPESQRLRLRSPRSLKWTVLWQRLLDRQRHWPQPSEPTGPFRVKSRRSEGCAWFFVYRFGQAAIVHPGPLTILLLVERM